MTVVYFLAGFICGLAIAWYLTKQHYDTRSISIEEHEKMIKKPTQNREITGNAEDAENS